MRILLLSSIEMWDIYVKGKSYDACFVKGIYRGDRLMTPFSSHTIHNLHIGENCSDKDAYISFEDVVSVERYGLTAILPRNGNYAYLVDLTIEDEAVTRFRIRRLDKPSEIIREDESPRRLERLRIEREIEENALKDKPEPQILPLEDKQTIPEPEELTAEPEEPVEELSEDVEELSED